jgi:hypothetical protein
MCEGIGGAFALFVGSAPLGKSLRIYAGFGNKIYDSQHNILASHNKHLQHMTPT